MAHPLDIRFVDIIAFWPGPKALSDELSRRGYLVSAGAVKQWRNRDSVPAAFFIALADACAAAGHSSVTVDVLARIAARSALPGSSPADLGESAAAGSMAPAIPTLGSAGPVAAMVAGDAA